MARPVLRTPRKIIVPKTKRSKKAHTATNPWDRNLVDMKLFWKYTNWAEWWEDFYLSVDDKGNWLWDTLRRFIDKKAESVYQRDFMYWYLGSGNERNPKYSFLPDPGIPLDWVEKRRTGGWKTDANLKAIEGEISRQSWAVDALRTVGNKITVASITRAERLAKQLDEAIRGVLFLPNAPLKFSVERALSIINIYREIDSLKEHAIATYARCHGVNFDDMSSLMHMMEASVLAAKTIDGKVVESTESKAMASLIKMAISKAATYGHELPPGVEDSLVDIAGEEVEEPGSKKKVQ